MSYLEERLKMKNGMSTPKEKKAYSIPKISKKRLEQNKLNEGVNKDKSDWFLDKVSKLKGRCVNCGEPISKNNVTFAIMSVAHVLAKRKNQFPSVALHPDNWVELCVTKGCHPKYDTGWETASKMPFFNMVLPTIRKLYPLLTDEEKNRIPDFVKEKIF